MLERERERERERGKEQLVVFSSIIPARPNPSIMSLILCFSIKLSSLWGVNIFLISQPTLAHLKDVIAPELPLSLMHDIDLIRPHRETPPRPGTLTDFLQNKGAFLAYFMLGRGN